MISIILILFKGLYGQNLITSSPLGFTLTEIIMLVQKQ